MCSLKSFNNANSHYYLLITCLCSILQLSPLHPSVFFPTHCPEQRPDKIPYSPCVCELCEQFPAAHSGHGEAWIARGHVQVSVYAGAPGSSFWRRDVPCVSSWPENWWRWQWVMPHCLPNTNTLWGNRKLWTYSWDQGVWINRHMVEEVISTKGELMQLIYDILRLLYNCTFKFVLLSRWMTTFIIRTERHSHKMNRKWTTGKLSATSLRYLWLPFRA